MGYGGVGHQQEASWVHLGEFGAARGNGREGLWHRGALVQEARTTLHREPRDDGELVQDRIEPEDGVRK